MQSIIHSALFKAIRPREGFTLSTFRLHSQLSLSIRKSAELRNKLEAGQLKLANKLLLRCLGAYYSMRTRQLIQHLHSTSTLAGGPLPNSTRKSAMDL
jgi:hypothetical protein